MILVGPVTSSREKETEFDWSTFRATSQSEMKVAVPAGLN